MIIKFNPSQAQKFRYPPGCPVIRFTSNDANDNSLPNNMCAIEQGVVTSIYTDNESNQFLYDISINKSDNLSHVNEAELAFGVGCNVYVTSDGAADMIGTVLSCKRKKRSAKGVNPNVYTVRLEIDEKTKALAHDIPAGRVEYRSTEPVIPVADPDGNTMCSSPAPETKTDASTDTTTVPPSIESDGNIASPPEKFRKESPAETKPNNASTSSCDSCKPKRTLETLNLPIPRKEPRKETKVEHSDRPRRQSAGGVIRFQLPSWIQKDRTMQRALFYHLIGPKDKQNKSVASNISQKQGHDKEISRSERNSEKIKSKTGVIYRVIPNDKNGDSDDITRLITIELRIQEDKDSEANEESLIEARHMVEDILLNFSFGDRPTIDKDGSGGRLLYGIAASCAGPHQNEESTSKAVGQRYDGETTCMSIVKLPFVTEEDGKRTFCTRSSYLQKDHLLNRIQLAKCRNIVCDTKWCDPYVLVLGNYWADVDKAVTLLDDEIRRHIEGCRCSFA